MSDVLDKSFIHISYPKLAYGSIHSVKNSLTLPSICVISFINVPLSVLGVFLGFSWTILIHFGPLRKIMKVINDNTVGSEIRNVWI